MEKVQKSQTLLIMKNIRFVCVILSLLLAAGCGNKHKTITKTDKNGFKYQIVTNDPYNLRVYTLDNGLKVYLSVNSNEPRIQTYIAVKAGSTFDPSDNTGLAHYLEHLMFKGSSRMGTINWQAEKPILDSIESLYERHKYEPTDKGRKAIYHRIDSLSGIAARYAVPNEFDKLIANIGGKNVNAYTTTERTVYHCDIPSNELERWLQIESERMFDMQMRLFHTELESVYEEFNQGQDNDDMKAYTATLTKLFPTHPYGQQTVIGKAEHLKSPSMVEIKKYYHKYYVPNNMAVCLAGDFNPEEAVCLINKHFGNKPGSTVERPVFAKEQPMTANSDTSVYGPQSESVFIGYRLAGINSDDTKIVTLINYMLLNDRAGLIDVDLIQKQKILQAYLDFETNNDYSDLIIIGEPNYGQPLEEVRDLLLAEIEKVKNGEFDEWLIKACINNLKLDEVGNQINRSSAAHIFAETFTHNIRWQNYLQFNDDLAKISKNDIMEFAKTHFDHYTTVYKRSGVDTNTVKVDKPQITPLPPQGDTMSVFANCVMKTETENIEPQFVNYKTTVKTQQLDKNVGLGYIKNTQSPLFELDYIFEMGRDNSLLLELAGSYLPLIGTEKYSAEQLQQELFSLGLSFNIVVQDRRTFIGISGLEDNVEKGVELLEDILANAKPDTSVYADFISQIEQNREMAKKSQTIIRHAMGNYAKYGPKSAFTNVLKISDIAAMQPDTLTNLIHSLENYPHSIFYYGQKSEKEIAHILKRHHKASEAHEEIPAPAVYPERDLKNEVYFVDFDMVQAMILVITKTGVFQPDMIPFNEFFNEFYSGNMSSVFFQDIRELKGLAYSTSSNINTPGHSGDSFYNLSYVATQFDKMQSATDEVLFLLNNRYNSDMQFESSKNAIRKKIESERIIGSAIYAHLLINNDLNIDYDIRKKVYDKMQTLTQDEFYDFFEKNISRQPKTVLVLGNRNLIDMKALGKYGKVRELTLEQIFGY